MDATSRLPREVERFNEATIEQTAEDRKKLHKQLQRVQSYDAYIADRVPGKARMLKEETHRMLTDLEPQEVVTLRRGEDGELHDEKRNRGLAGDLPRGG